jgi:pyruvate/2-oxoglutarate dehydrogenase complex dihydrolipoamide dehydrogenase (E3) component
VAATNAMSGAKRTLADQVNLIGRFTDPGCAQVDTTETETRAHNVVGTIARFDEKARTIIDGRTNVVCKLIVHSATCGILGWYNVGGRAVEIVRVTAIAMAASMPVNDLARVPLSFPTYAGSACTDPCQPTAPGARR